MPASSNRWRKKTTRVGWASFGKKIVNEQPFPAKKQEALMKWFGRISLSTIVLCLVVSIGINPTVSQAQEGKIVPYVPTPQAVVDRMLELAQVKKGDVVYDLGSGDGRIVV